MLDAGPVVPAAVEEHPLAGSGELGHVALEVPLRLLALGRDAEGADAGDARVQGFGDALDDAALAGRVATFEEADDLEPAKLDPFLELDQLDLKSGQLGVVELALELLAGLLDQVPGRRIEPVCVSDRHALAALGPGADELLLSSHGRGGFHKCGGVLLGDGGRRGGSGRLRARPLRGYRLARRGCLWGRPLQLSFGGGSGAAAVPALMTVVMFLRHVGLLLVHVRPRPQVSQRGVGSPLTSGRSRRGFVGRNQASAGGRAVPRPRRRSPRRLTVATPPTIRAVPRTTRASTCSPRITAPRVTPTMGSR